MGKVASLTVVLEKDLKDEGLEAVMQAVKMTKGVAAVHPGEPLQMEDYMARESVRRELAETMLNVFWAVMDGRKITIEERKR